MKFRILLATLLSILGACASTDYDPYVAATANQLETRSYQTRDFSDVGHRQLMQAMVATLQDYHFRIREVDTELGTITAFQNTRSAGTTELTIFIKPRGDKHHAVRINMLTGFKVEQEPDLYQKFFTAVRKQLHYRGNV
jgi:hypothetical protein